MSTGSGQPQTASTTSTQNLSPDQQKLLDIAMPMAQQYASTPLTLYPGSSIAPTNDTTTAARTQALNAGGTIQGLSDSANSALSSLFSGGQAAPALVSSPVAEAAPVREPGVVQAGGITEPGVTQAAPISSDANLAAAQKFLLSDVMNPESNPALTGAVNAAVRPLTDAFSQQILPGIAGSAISNGALGGSRQGVAQGLASNSLMKSIGDTSSTLLNKAYSDSLQAMVSAFGTSNQRLSSIDAANTARAADVNATGTAQAADVNRTGTQRASDTNAATMARAADLNAQNTARTANTNATVTAREADINAQNTQRQANQMSTILQSLGLSPSLANLALLPSQTTEAVGTQQQTEAQNQLTETVQKYLAQQMLPLAQAQDIVGLASGVPGGTTTSSSTGPAPASNTMGTVTGIASILGLLFGL